MEGCRNKVFSSQAMSHCLGTSSLKPNCLFLFISQYQKSNFSTKHEQFIQTTLNQSHIVINLLTFLPC